LYRGSIISDDLRAAQIIISLDVSLNDTGTPAVTATLTKIRDTAQEMFRGLAEVYVSGQPLIGVSLSEAMSTDTIVLIPLVVAVLAAVLAFSFRKLTFVTLPLLTVIVSTIWAVVAMPLIGVKLNILSSILPVILIAVGSAYDVHLVSHYRDEKKWVNVITVEGHRELVLNLIKKLIKPVFLAALTTFIGFVSFCFTVLPPTREFGYFVSFGVIAACIVAVMLIPSFLLILGPQPAKHEKQKNRKAENSGRNLDFVNELSDTLSAVTRKKMLVLVISALVVAVSIYGLSKIIVDNAFIEFFREDTAINRSDRFIREYFGGSTQLTVSVEADSTEIMLSPEVLIAVDGLSVYLSERVPAVGKVIGFTDMIKRTNQMFNIGESPDGLRPITANFRGDTNSDFGDFGFGGFGNDTFFSYEDSSTDFTYDKNGIADISQLGAGEIISLLNKAAGKRANMSGNEVIRELERLVNYNGNSYYEIPAGP
jgi:predicted RND superfamily exporter protein